MKGRWLAGMSSAVVLGLVSAGCLGTDTTGPSAVADLVGTYVAEGAFGAVVFTTSTANGTEQTDWLERGASIRLVLNADMTTTGRFYAPGGDEDGGDLDADLAGTWTLQGNQVILSQEADTFIRDTPLVVTGDRLVGEKTFSATTIHVELARR